MKVVRIIGTEKKITTKDGKTEEYTVSHVICEDGSEATGIGLFEVGESVQLYFDEKYNRIKIRKKQWKTIKESLAKKLLK